MIIILVLIRLQSQQLRLIFFHFHTIKLFYDLAYLKMQLMHLVNSHVYISAVRIIHFNVYMACAAL